MLLNSSTLKTLGTGFKAAFQGGLGVAPTDHMDVAMEVPSTTAKEEYGFLGKMPRAREWLGDRVIQNLKAHDFTIRNKDHELTIGVDRNDIEDDNLGMYGTLFTDMGVETGSYECALVYQALSDGFSKECYDGQYFFDLDHPVIDGAGNVASVANTDGGNGPAWFLIDTTRVFRPIIFQRRKSWQFTSLDSATDENVFMRKEFLYGTDARFNVGYGLWQLCWGSKQPLTPANYEIARAALGSMKGDQGRPLGIKPNLLVVPSALEGAGKNILTSQLINGGETNKWAGTAALKVTPWL